MGVALWLLCGVAVFAGSRAIAVARPLKPFVELVIVITTSLASGLAATALDFGGWAQLDWRAAVFVVCCSFAAIGAYRLILLATRRVAQH